MVHPVEKFIFTMVSVIIVLVSENPAVPVMMFILMTCIIIFASGVNGILYTRLMLIPLIFIIFSIFTVMIKINSPVSGNIFTMKIFSITAGADKRSISEGGILFLKSLASVSGFYFFILSTPVVDFEYILKKLRFPQFFREMFMMVYRYIFILAGMSHVIYISQKSRLGYVSLWRGIRSSGSLASGVFVNSLIFGKKSYQAMLSRGYNGELKVIDMKYRFSPLNCIIIGLVELCFIILVIRYG